MKIRFLLYGLACASLLARAALVAESNYAADEDQQWASYKTRFDKLYDDPQEDAMRRANWLETKRQVDSWNSEGHSYRQAVNHLADWTAEELSRLTMEASFLSSRPDLREAGNHPFCSDYLDQMKRSVGSLPDEEDWRNKSRVGAVKDQRSCGSCWSFATTGLLEGQLKGDGPPGPLSEQQLIDCVPNSNGCCEGYFVHDALNHIARVGGIQADSTYPYEFRHNECRFDSSKAVAKVENFCRYFRPGAEVIQALVAKYGPVAVYMSAGRFLSTEKDNVYNGTECDEIPINHAVLIVGYGTDKKAGDYWIVKNSWGPGFNNGGYLKILRGVNKCWIEEWAFIANFPVSQ